MEEINLKELFKYFVSKLWLILIILVIALGSGLVYINCLQTPMYHGTTTLILVSSKDNTSVTQTDLTLSKNLVTTYSKIIKSRNVLSKVIKNLDLDESYEELSGSISVTSETDTEIINIIVSDASNKRAAKIANETATVFSKEVEKIYNLENISIIDKAIVEEVPYNVNVPKQLVIYSLGGLVLGFGLVFIMFYFDTTIKNSDNIEEKLGLTVLGVVPVVK